MTNFFNTYYVQQTSEFNSGVLIEVDSKRMSKRFLNTLGKIFGKKSENVNISNSKIAEVTHTAFNQLATKLSNNLISPRKKDRTFYIKNLYNGKIVDPNVLNSDYKKIQNSSVFKLNNGGRIYLISVENNDGDLSYYVGTNNSRKANDFFIELIGKTFDLYLASKKIIRKKKIITPKKHTFNIDKKEPELKKSKDIKPEIEPKESLEKVAIINTDISTIEQLIDKWGNGNVGYGLFKHSYKYKNLLKRTPFENNWGRGYKYQLNGDMDIYIINSIKNPNVGKIIFKNEKTYSRATNLDMIPWFSPGTKIQWEYIDIKNM